MKKPFNISAKLKSEKGVTLVYVALLLVVFLGMAALAIDIGYLMVSRNELQNAADASALAATRQLGSIYEPMSYTAQQTYVCNPGVIIPVAQATASSNTAAGQSVTVLNGDVVIGTWDSATKVLTQTLNQPDAVRVTTRRDNTPGVGGRVGTFFARIFGQNEVDVSATATAALTALSTANVADIELPVGISKVWLDGSFCNKDIHFYPTDSCAGWTDFQTKKGSYDPDDKSVSNPDILDLLHDIRLRNLPYPGMPPEVITNSTKLPFTGGTLSNPTFAEMEALFNSRKICCDESGNSYWDTLVLVYDRPGDTTSKCGNPNDAYTIVGFVTIRLTEVIDAAGKYLKAVVECDRVEQGRGGGGNYGTKGSIPNLVQ